MSKVDEALGIQQALGLSGDYTHEMSIEFLQQLITSAPWNRVQVEKHYELQALVNRSPRAEVYRAQRWHHNESCAIKLIRSSIWSRPRELDVLTQTNHPGIVRLLGNSRTRQGQHLLELEWVDGEPLTNWIDHLPAIPFSERLTVFLELAHAVGYLHWSGWIHGDLAPQNVLVSPTSRRVVLIDFEFAHRVNHAGKKTFRQHSLDYASPAERKGGQTTMSCEQYALACIGRELLVDVDWTQSHEHPAHAVETLLKKAGSPDPDSRYATVHELARNVESLCAAERTRGSGIKC